jgi:TRAP-type C4-dicarboxylate transport system permease small subunit
MDKQDMSPMRRTLLMIAVFVALIVGSFIWFIATWDPTREQPVTGITPSVVMVTA